ncbi:MAG TPA: hypothetical protein VJC03_07925, partial [bacterium]|nr:hypothetical protein [bacterium]
KACEEFLRKYPDSGRDTELKHKMEETSFERLLEMKNSVPADAFFSEFRAFQKAFPESAYLSEIQPHLKELLFLFPKKRLAELGLEKLNPLLDFSSLDSNFDLSKTVIIISVFEKLKNTLSEIEEEAASKGKDLFLREKLEAFTKGNLSDIRSAIDSYREANGQAPRTLESLTAEKDPDGNPLYFESLPPAYLMEHELSTAVKTGAKEKDEGGWNYNASSGRVSVNCTHPDTKNAPAAGW